VIVAVVAMGMVQVIVHQVVNVIAMRHGRVAAVLAMMVTLLVVAAIVACRASGWICWAHS